MVIRSCLVLAFIILGFVTHDITHIPAFIIAMIGAGVLLVFEDPDRIFEHVEWNTIFFFIGLFLVIGGVEASGAINIVADMLMKITIERKFEPGKLVIAEVADGRLVAHL